MPEYGLTKAVKVLILKGKLADIAVLSDNLLICSENQIKNIKVLFTMVGGKVVYSNDLLKLNI